MVGVATYSDLGIPAAVPGEDTIQSGRETWLDDAAATTRRAGATARSDGGDVIPRQTPGIRPGVPALPLLTRRHHVDLLRTASAACRL